MLKAAVFSGLPEKADMHQDLLARYRRQAKQACPHCLPLDPQQLFRPRPCTGPLLSDGYPKPVYITSSPMEHMVLEFEGQ